MSRINFRNTTGLLAIAASLALTAFAGVSQAQKSRSGSVSQQKAGKPGSTARTC